MYIWLCKQRGEDMDKTIKDLAKEIGVSVQAVHQAKNKLLENETLKKKGNAFVLNPRQQAIIKSSFKTDDKEIPSSNLNESLNILKSELSTLKQYNQVLSNELDTKNKQIEQLHILLLKEKEVKQLPENIADDLEPEARKASVYKREESPKKRKWYEIFTKKE